MTSLRPRLKELNDNPYIFSPYYICKTFLEILSIARNVLIISTNWCNKMTKETNWEQKIKKKQNESMRKKINTEMNGNFPFWEFGRKCIKKVC